MNMDIYAVTDTVTGDVRFIEAPGKTKAIKQLIAGRFVA